ncbi:MAG: NAD(P)H-dependent oxidoreductase [Candidatus Hydrogenedentes bacterium]|nr:NAD(P)H-dependent oxidoreductase [Candidatus Hydrogenedentota bacterium]
MPFLVFSCSLNPKSRSRVLAHGAVTRLEAHGADAEFIDLQELPLPLCDGATSQRHPHVIELRRRIVECEGALIAVPVYNFDVNAAAKNLVELTGDAWRDKVVGFLCAAGGQTSFMAVMGLANSMMLDFRSIIVPRFVYATEADVVGEQIADARTLERLDEVVSTLVRLARAINPVPQGS